MTWSHYFELLKIGEVEHEHIGQMKLYLGYYEKEVNDENDNQPIDIILSEEKDDIMVDYAMLNDSAKLIVSKYQLYLPDTEELKNKVKKIIEKLQVVTKNLAHAAISCKYES